jgi:hypothetical protein
MNEICGNSCESSEIVKRRLSEILWSTLWTRSSLTTDGWPLHSSSSTFVHPSLNILHLFLKSSFTHDILAVNRAQFTMDFHNTHVFSVKKAYNRVSQLAGLSIAGHIINHFVETSTNTKWPVMWRFTKQWVLWPHLDWASSPSLPRLNGGYFPNSPRLFNHSMLI